MNTVRGHVRLPASVLPSHLQYPNINHPSPSLFSLLHLTPVFLFVCFFPPFLSCVFLLSSLTSANRSIFLIFPCVMLRILSNVFNIKLCFGLLPGGQSCRFCRLGQTFIFLFFVDVVYLHQVHMMYASMLIFRLPGVGGDCCLFHMPVF